MSLRKAPTDVHKTVSRLLKGKLIRDEPAWLSAVRRIPPGPSIVRSVSKFDTTGTLSFEDKEQKFKGNPVKRVRKWMKYKTVKPPKIEYPEDKLRRQFYKDHPQELLRPRMLIETDGQNRSDWSQLATQDGKKPQEVNGESVVQYQLHLMSQGYTTREAYVLATSEFYKIKSREDTELMIAKQQAQHFGADMAKSSTRWAIEKEDEALAETEMLYAKRKDMRQMQQMAEQAFTPATE
ncbi:mitochondrial ribosomal small subunit component [Basidiobolus ranarum]|uniref:Small ribosomal subunit protein mS23 n=1 Tax=Basidiobolus ranarum TaxID=34480 RepID=A0ABR2WKS3_9FUNG